MCPLVLANRCDRSDVRWSLTQTASGASFRPLSLRTSRSSKFRQTVSRYADFFLLASAAVATATAAAAATRVAASGRCRLDACVIAARGFESGLGKDG